MAFSLVSYYSGNESGQTPGVLPNPPYYWWEAGGMFNSLIDYWYYTGDSTYNNITVQGVVFQAGPGNAFMVRNRWFDERVLSIDADVHYHTSPQTRLSTKAMTIRSSGPLPR